MKKKCVLLHVCCAPCATSPIERLISEYDITLFFSNSNIFPESEYDKRLLFAKKIAKEFNLDILFDNYAHNDWLNHIKGYENEPEKGKRCEKCFDFNITRTAIYAKKNNFDYFTTTLTVSPHKPAQKIFDIANKFDNFLEIDFKKKNGFARSVELSKYFNLYRQNYCGCEFSLNHND